MVLCACKHSDMHCVMMLWAGDLHSRDFSGKTPLDYATEKGLHYCGLILTKAESLETVDE